MEWTDESCAGESPDVRPPACPGALRERHYSAPRATRTRPRLQSTASAAAATTLDR